MEKAPSNLKKKILLYLNNTQFLVVWYCTHTIVNITPFYRDDMYISEIGGGHIAQEDQLDEGGLFPKQKSLLLELLPLKKLLLLAGPCSPQVCWARN